MGILLGILLSRDMTQWENARLECGEEDSMDPMEELQRLDAVEQLHQLLEGFRRLAETGHLSAALHQQLAEASEQARSVFAELTNQITAGTAPGEGSQKAPAQGEVRRMLNEVELDLSCIARRFEGTEGDAVAQEWLERTREKLIALRSELSEEVMYPSERDALLILCEDHEKVDELERLFAYGRTELIDEWIEDSDWTKTEAMRRWVGHKGDNLERLEAMRTALQEGGDKLWR
jgi:hypothetical protein